MKTSMWIGVLVMGVALAGCGSKHADNEAAAAAKAEAQMGNTQIYAVPRLSNGLDCAVAVNPDLSRLSLSCEHAPTRSLN